jgi:hypothetical protein
MKKESKKDKMKRESQERIDKFKQMIRDSMIYDGQIKDPERLEELQNNKKLIDDNGLICNYVSPFE